MSQQYYFAMETYLSVTAEAAILLDANRGEYIALTPEQTATFRRYIHGWPPDDGLRGSAANIADQQAHEVLDSFVDRGLLTTDPGRGKSHAHTVYAGVDDWLVDPDTLGASAISLGNVLRMAQACLWARKAMHLGSTAALAGAIEEQRRQLAGDRQESSAKLARARRLAAVFIAIRPWFYTHKNKCLFDSLVLIRFLCLYRVFPRLVFGVRDPPFSAHAWIEYMGLVANTRPGFVRRFSAIYIV